MRDEQASLTAATVAFAASLRWYTGDQNAMLQAELMRSISWRHMPLPLWLFARFILCHEFISKTFLQLWLCIQGSSKAVEGLWMRKLYMENQVREFLDKNDAKNKQNLQVLIVAAGYDTLAWRLAFEYPMVKFIELDHPATGRAKIKAMYNAFSNRPKKGTGTSGANGVISAHNSTDMPSSLYFCHKAISDKSTLKEALESGMVNGSFRKSEIETLCQNTPTAIVVEGLTFYLTEEENRAMFQQLGDLFGNSNSMIAFNFFQLDEYGRPTTPNTQKTSFFSSWVTTFFKYKVKLFGEPFKWGIKPENLAHFFDGTGWSLVTSKFGDESCQTIMLGIEYEATVEWTGQ